MQFAQLIDVSTMADLMSYADSVAGIVTGLAAGGNALLMSADQNRIALIMSGTQLASYMSTSSVLSGAIIASAGNPVILSGAQFAAFIVRDIRVFNRGAAAGDFSAVAITAKLPLPSAARGRNCILGNALAAQNNARRNRQRTINEYAASPGESPPLSYPLFRAAHKPLLGPVWRGGSSRRWRPNDLASDYASRIETE